MGSCCTSLPGSDATFLWPESTMSPMGTTSFPLMFGGFGSSASLYSPAWQSAGLPAKQVKAVIISLWKPIFGCCFITAAELFPALWTGWPQRHAVVRGENLAQHFLVPSSISAPGCAHAHTIALQPSQCPCCGCRSGKNTHTRNELKSSVARGQLCGGQQLVSQ